MIINHASMLQSSLLDRFTEAGYQFRKSASEFHISSGAGDVKAVWIDLLPASRKGYFKAALSAHVRIGALEAVYVDHHPFVPPAERKRHFTLDVNCDNLFRDRSVSQSFELLSPHDIGTLADRLWVAVKADVFGFLDRYSDREALVANLSSDDYRLWVTSDRMVRYTVLLSDRALAGDRSGFEKWATEFLAYCHEPHGQMYLPTANAIVPAVRLRYFER